eukprot:TCONS_00007824-protein
MSQTEALEELSKEDLIKKCQDLLRTNNHLKAELKSCKQKLKLNSSVKSKAKRMEPNQRPIDFSQYHKKRIALRILYHGWDYCGFASQENTENTVEEQIFIALIKGKLIEDRVSANYSRCGRTDKGVSAFGQVIALDVRGRKKEEFCVEPTKGILEPSDIPYVKALNRLLPLDIRVIAYADVTPDFDARFSCGGRTYKYFFPASNLDVEVMHEAAQRLLGEHDFRNFCKVDVGNNINHFMRNIVRFHVRRVQQTGSPRDMCEMEITGRAFLWHQVRCMAAVLFLIGLHHEKPQVIDFLLDIEKCPKRPQYGIASEIPLILYDCTYENINWVYEKDFNDFNIQRLEEYWVEKSVQSIGLRTMIDYLHEKIPTDLLCPASCLLTGYAFREYQPLEERNVCGGLERHLEKQAVKRIKLEGKYQQQRQKEEASIE